MQIDLTETELNILQKGMCLIRDSIRKPHEEMIAIHIQEKVRDALAKLEEEKTYPVQAIFDDAKEKKYEWKYNKDNCVGWFYWSDSVLLYSINGINVPVDINFLTAKYHRRERKTNE